MAVNNTVRLAARPVGPPQPTDWRHTTEDAPDLEDGQFLVRIRYVSLDPAMRGWMNDIRSYVAPVRIGEVMRAFGLGVVVESRHPKYHEGDHVTGLFGVQDYAVSDGDGVTVVDPGLAPLPRYLGALGVPGLTAYFGVLEVARAREGETVVVSGAAGAVGSVAGQIAKRLGCRVIGIAGGPRKCAWLTGELGFDAAIDYRSPDVRRQLIEHAREVDVYFDNVGGEILDQVLARIRPRARIVLCGAISQYDVVGKPRAPENYLSLLINRASMTGMLVDDFADRYDQARGQLTDWLRSGAVIAVEHVIDGDVHDFPAALASLFAGENTGKLVLRLDRSAG